MPFTEQQRRAIEEATAKVDAQKRFTPEQRKAVEEATAKVQTLGPVDRFAQGSALPVAQLADFLVGSPAAGVARKMGFDAPDKPVQELFSRYQMTPPGGKPEGMAGAMGEMTGIGALSIVPMLGPSMGAGGAAARGVAQGMAPRAQSTMGRVGEQIAETAVRRPGAFAAGELAAASGAGAGGYKAEELFPGSPAARATGEILGGFTPAATIGAAKAFPGAAAGALGVTTTGSPLAAFTAPAVAAVRRLVLSKTPTGARSRAKARFDRALPDPQSDVQRLNRTDILPDSKLTPAQKTGEPQMLALERSVMESTPELSAARQQQFAEENAFLRQSLREMAGDTEPGQARDYLQSLLDTRLRIAALKSDEAIAALAPGSTAEDANRLARRELDRALSAARGQENQLYAAIAPDTPIDVTQAATRMMSLKQSMGQAQQGDIPAAARKFLDPDSASYFGDQTSMLEIRSLQSKLREAARIARGRDQFNKARIADDIADALTNDVSMAQVPDDQREALQTAIGFSRDLNDRFTKGPVGSLLGYDASGAAATPPGLTLETTIGARGAKAAVEADALLEAVRRSGDEPALRSHVEDFLKDKFRQQTALGREIDPKKADAFLRQNDEVLRRFPELRRQFEQARDAGESVVAAQRFSDPEVSRAAVFLKAEPGKEFDRVVATANPAKAMREVVALAKQDPTGVALKGVKATAIDKLWKAAHTSTSDVTDQPFLSGTRLREALAAPKTQQALNELFSPEEMKRLRAISQEAQLLERARHAASAEEGVLGDRPSQVTTTLAGIFGAFAGRRMGTGTIQVPGKTANFAVKAVEYMVSDPGKRLVVDAIQDEKLFRAITMEIVPGSIEREKFVAKQLHGWAVGVLAEYGIDPQDLEDQEEPATP